MLGALTGFIQHFFFDALVFLAIGIVIGCIFFIARPKILAKELDCQFLLLCMGGWPVVLVMVALEYMALLDAWLRTKMDRIMATWREWRKNREAK